MLTDFGFIFLFIYIFVWNDKRERGPRRAWAFTWLDIVLLALWESDTRTAGRVCSAVGRGPWRVTNVRTAERGAGQPVMMELVGSIARTAPGARAN